MQIISIHRTFFFLFSIFFYLLLSCSEVKITSAEEKLPEDRIEAGESLFIIDRTGERWDITHAAEKYGFRAENFQYGLGKNAIPSIDYPDMFQPGEPGYPLANDNFIIIAARIRSDTRAYPIFVMKSHEIVNESFSGQLVAVAY